MSNLTSASGISTLSSNPQASFASPNPVPAKKKRNLPGNPDPDAEVIALSPKTLMATNRFVCEICNKGFQRDQNLQLHRRGHNLPWKLKQRTNKEVRKKVYICPEVSCVHHEPSRALGDLTGIKKHFSRKHGEKKWKCDKCSKKYAVQSDWKAHTKICGTREYRCDCGTLFSRRDSFITHRAFCDALAEESAKTTTMSEAAAIGNPNPLPFSQPTQSHDFSLQPQYSNLVTTTEATNNTTNNTSNSHGLQEQQQQYLPMKPEVPSISTSLNHADMSLLSIYSTRLNPDHFPPLEHGQSPHASSHLSATALLQKAALMGATMSRAPYHSQMVGAHTSSSATGGFGLGLSSDREVGGGSALGFPDMMVSPLSSASCIERSLEGEVNGVGNMTRSHGRNEERGGGGDDLTRDFLGLRAFSHREILNMAGLDSCMNPSTCDQP
ncbi:zinc finger protein GAI-ASSOCIATED FACTOR 1-like [Typha angustifolia]|uniref:zinc finger protein GAI-ASSOCIATED FACTOR 1-like n=1 Tax=Typha angustifolia TaxID=59011 RepID=UPI003C2F7DF4